MCDRNNGRCTDGCNAGFFGPSCTAPCSGNCYNKSCFQENGTCVEGCKPGFFEDLCQTPCLRSGFCLHDTCYRSNGSCNQGCIQGWQDPDCNECSATYYGNACTERCQNCIDGACFRQNGSCINGCIDDCKTDNAVNTDFSERQRNFGGTDFTIIGAGVAGTVFILILIVVVVIVLRARCRTQDGSTQKILYQKKSHDKKEILNGTDLPRVTIRREDETEEPYEENPDEAVYYNDLTTTRDIKVSDLSSIIKHKEANENEGFVKQFKNLPYGERFDCETAKLEENFPKNRFKTTFPYDHSRVILQRSDGFTSDYINANHVANMEGHSEFIACQGPLAVTLVDHWRMVWQEHIDYIVMLTNLKEGPKVKCHQYWPNDGKRLDAGPFVITSVEEKVYACFIERKMVVRKKGVSESRTLVQFHYIQWPDHGTPNPLDLAVFHRQFRHTVPPSQHPILVHCSAGIGRTGTFIALDVLCRYGEKKGKINVVEYVKAMRKDRMTMIQNADQYAFLYRALYEFFRRKWSLNKKEDFLKLFGDTERPKTRKLLTDEFNELTNLRPKYSYNEFKTGKKYAKLNAVRDILPVEKYLVYLTSNIPGREQYYNAVTVSSFSRAEEFISAQFPVPGAIVDLIRLLVDQESHFLISLNPLSDDNELKGLVEEEIIKLDSYEITKEKQTTLSNGIRKTSLQIKQLKVYSGIHKVHIFECLNWDMSHRIPQEASTLGDLIKQFNLDRKAEKEGHITVISKDGAICCGVFIAVYNAIEQLQQDNLLDLFTIIQQLQCRRPQMISSKEEYEFCVKTMCDLVTFDNVYANT
ncbi:receptor-type tyrosine-protein phosphatase epsilon-like [Saccostrea cucullata]|uniref:receptor-type tyrosine-protein phosphatase epsilon-like n=1 Tax=Saccostrea cuccullata TaxID=36930 RepID=UPI002ED1AF5E